MRYKLTHRFAEFQEMSQTELRGSITFLSEITFALMCLLGMALGTDVIFGKKLPWLLGFAIPPCRQVILLLTQNKGAAILSARPR
jgi:hypothetical protein